MSIMGIMRHETRQDLIFDVAGKVAPFFASRYDYSAVDQYERVAEQSFLCAEAIVRKHEAMLIAATAKDEAEATSAAKEAKPNA